MHHLPFLLAAAFIFYVQATLARLSDYCPDVGPLLAVYIGLFARREHVATAALLLGLLRASLDLEPAAAMVLIFLAVAKGCAAVRDIVFSERALTQWIVAFGATALYVILYRIAGVALAMGSTSGGNLMPKLALSTFGAVLVAPGLIGLLRMLRVGP